MSDTKLKADSLRKQGFRANSALLALLFLFIFLGAGLSGCQKGFYSLPSPPAEAKPSPQAAANSPQETLAPTQTEESPTPAPIITLTIWTKESFSPAEGEAGQVLNEIFSAFSEKHPDVHIEYALKKPYGKGGLLDFLRTTSQVVPAALPDLIVIDTTELNKAAREGLVQPLDGLLGREILDDVFPFAIQACSLDGHLMGMQFEADIEHLAYNAGLLPAPPLTWADTFTRGAIYLFPGGGEEEKVNDAFLIQYIALGGQFVDKNGLPALDKELLVKVLEFYQEGRKRNVIPLSILECKTLDDSWAFYLAGKAAMANVDSHLYLLEGLGRPDTSFAPIPTQDGRPMTISRGWAVALVTSDQARQALAAELIASLMRPEMNAAWNRAAGHLPTRRAALDDIGLPEDYLAFLRTQMEAARPRPSMPAYDNLAKALQRAIQNVLLNDVSPAEAVEGVFADLGGTAYGFESLSEVTFPGGEEK